MAIIAKDVGRRPADSTGVDRQARHHQGHNLVTNSPDMSVSLHTSQVNRLNDELARLRSKLADERKKITDANAKALKATDGSPGRATSASQLKSKAREVERHQKAAADHEKKVPDIEKQIANKQRSLTSAQTSLDRAQRDQQKKDDRKAEKRRRADIDHIKAMERARRSATNLPESFVPRPPPSPANQQQSNSFTDTYDVCLSFAGERRDYVERIAGCLEGGWPRCVFRPGRGHRAGSGGAIWPVSGLRLGPAWSGAGETT